jgi:UDPglucose--hexose-1-phosphate uridylyltransferase
MNRRVLRKPDGRMLILYGREAIADSITAPSPSTAPFAPNAHLRWHPLRGEWVAYATHRQNRTFLPPPEYNPLAPTRSPDHPTELPAGEYDAAVFENLFPTFTALAHDPPQLTVATREARGACEVVVFTRDPAASLGRLPLWHIELILGVWTDRYRELGGRSDVSYVYVFENRGVEVGVTLNHPHGQIYAYPFIPPIPARELEHERAHFANHGTTLIARMVADELEAGRRVLYQGAHVAAFVPICARYPYEVWVAPVQPVPSLDRLDEQTCRDFARALKTVLMKYDALWDRPFPYIMAMHQAPTDGVPHPESHLHIEFYPAYRMRDRLKYLAGSEMGAGVFTADTDPDDKAAELKNVQVSID